MRSLTEFLASPGHRDEARRLGIPGRLEHARAELERVRSPEYVKALVGTIGADPVHRPVHGRPGRDGARGGSGRGMSRARRLGTIAGF